MDMKNENNKDGYSDLSNPWRDFQQIDVGGDIYEQIFKYSIFPTIVHDMAMNIIKVNDSALQEFGFSRSELLKKSIFDLHTEDEIEHSSDVLESMKYSTWLSTETKFRRKDGSIFSAQVTPCKYILGDTPIIHVHIENITERKRAEAKMQELNTALEVEMARVEFHSKKLEIKTKELEEFAYVAAHDLKAPITNLNVLSEMINADRLSSQADIQLFSKLKNNIDQIYKTIFTLNEVINFKTTLKDKKEYLVFENVFNEVAQSITEQLNSTNTILSVDFSECTEIEYPPLHLKSVLQNLLTNAVKYKSPNKLLKIEVKTCIVNGSVCLTMKDNGLGFDVEKYGRKVFGLFKRLHTHVEGKGVGMYIVKSIVVAHGGSIEVKSKPNKGTLFTVYLNNRKDE
ncbi:phytochrome-like protein cph1 [Arenibacter sp. NBRC 103722]|uniref:sensor histidine kinase n=2 Tax=Arenibacter TaxID=178469 RepID=UPI0008530C86|nr:PAS domain-containing sensor histidine kinase [Arenibacter sp. NBRC 103722]MDX1766472.1 PAS domain-containing sensor histidine kinase [Arenibacter troitsensis]GBF22141.1 phytochrome-like protein cph1 [Arenibacter sp. NBRC 103722]